MAQQTAVASKEKKHAPILIPKDYQNQLEAFKDQNGFPGYGEAIQALINCFRNNLKIKQELDSREKDLDRREQELSNAEKEFLAYEQQLQNGAGVNQQTFAFLASLLEQGTSPQSLEELCAVIRDSALPIAELTRGMQEAGGLANQLIRLRQLKDVFLDAAEKAKQDKDRAEEGRLAAAKEILTAGEALEGLEAEKGRARQEIQQIMAGGQMIEAAYGQLGILMDGVIGRLLGTTPLTSLPEAGVRTLAGIVLLTYAELFGDRKISVPVNHDPSVLRIVPVPLMLSEIPALLASKEVYRQVQEKLTKEAGQ